MNAREAILTAVRSNLPQPPVPLPEIPTFWQTGEPHPQGCQQSHDPGEGSNSSEFNRELQAIGGSSFKVADAQAAQAKLKELFPNAKVVCSAVPDVPGTRHIADVRDPHELDDVDVGIVRSPLGVAEAGAVWVTQKELVINALGVLSQHLIVLLDPAAIVQTMHDAYNRIALTESPYGVFLAGPSATGDIEGVMVRGAQGARSLTVLFMSCANTSISGGLCPPCVLREMQKGDCDRR
jgi:L-lactate dehydrogenase complex protein LldG